MCDDLRVMTICAQAAGKFGKFRRRLLGQGLAGAPGAELFGVGERPLEQAQAERVGEIGKRDDVSFGDSVGKVGSDYDLRDIRGDEQRRITERTGVEQQLTVGGVEVAAFLFIFPGEAAAAPDIGPAVLAGKLVAPFSKA